MKKLDNNDIKRLRVSKQTTSRRVYNIPQVTTMRDGQEQWIVTNHGDLRHYKKESGQVWESRYKKYTGDDKSVFSSGVTFNGIADFNSNVNIDGTYFYINSASTYVNGILQILGHTSASSIFVNNALSVSTEAKFGSSASYTKFNAAGQQTMYGGARVWRDELGDVTRLRFKGTNISVSESQNALVFGSGMAAAADYVYVNMQLNHDRDTGTVIKPHIHWEQTSASQPAFILDYRWQVNGQAKDTSWASLLMNTSKYTYSSGTLNQISYSASISPPANSGTSDIIQFRVGRDDSVVGGTAPDVLVTSFDVHIYTNKIGTQNEY